MVSLEALWIPILLSAVIVFIASSIIHMALPWHKGDYPKLAAEQSVMDALLPLALPPGDYMIPRASHMNEMKTPQFQERMRKGPVILMTIRPNGTWKWAECFYSGLSIQSWCRYSQVMSAAARCRQVPRIYMCSRSSAPRQLPATPWHWPKLSIWYGRGWNLTIRSAIDGVIYGALTAGTFGWLWPAA